MAAAGSLGRGGFGFQFVSHGRRSSEERKIMLHMLLLLLLLPELSSA
jgi:ABC-type methionine transport system permease subunit